MELSRCPPAHCLKKSLLAPTIVKYKPKPCFYQLSVASVVRNRERT